MDASTAAVCIIALVLIYRLVLVAFDRKGDVRAGARVGPSSFFVEVRDKKSSSSKLPS